jgi:hypothetical protein
MTSTWRQHYTLGIMLMMIGLMAGCTLFNKPLGDNPLPPPSPSDNGPFAYALSMYQRGDYTQAAKLFNALSRPNTGDDQYLKAQLGEICCRLMLSASAEDLSTAKKMWKDLKNTRAGDIWRVEQILFDPLMDRLLVSVAKPTVMTPEPPKKTKQNRADGLEKENSADHPTSTSAGCCHGGKPDPEAKNKGPGSHRSEYPKEKNRDGRA